MTDDPHVGSRPSDRSASKMVRLVVSAVCGTAAGVVVALTSPWQAVPLLLWVVTALVWIGPLWWHVARMDAAATSRHATSEAPRGPAAEAILLAASVASLGAVVLGIIKASDVHGAEKALLLSAGVAAIVASWGVVHSVFTLRYAVLFYQGPDGGIDFHDNDQPCYADFAYMAFTIGMTYQVSDTDLKAKLVRHTALRHSLLSYLFGTVIVAATINLAAGLVK